MKHLKSFFTLAVIAATMMLTSCLKEADTSENTYSASAYCMIKGSYPNYKLYADDGLTVIIPSPESVSNMTKSKGFGDAERAFFSFGYKQKDFAEDPVSKQVTIKNATLNYGVIINVQSPVEKSVADEKLITDKDSTDFINTFSEAWIARGYLNLVVESSVYKDAKGNVLKPAMNVVYDITKFGENKMALTLCYNNHKNATLSYSGSVKDLYCFRISDLVSLVPGSDKISVVITPANGGEQKTITVDRSLFLKPNFEAY